jgi:hypothetical protein
VFRRQLAFLTAFACLAPNCLAAETTEGSKTALQLLTRGRATEILANTDTIADGLARLIKNPGNPQDEAIFDDVSDVMAHESEWRWYSRDHGVLLAIPVRERLGIAARANAENLLADIVRRLIYQRGWGNPPVQVVFIEPEIPCHVPCNAGANVAASWTAGAACDCR